MASSAPDQDVPATSVSEVEIVIRVRTRPQHSGNSSNTQAQDATPNENDADTTSHYNWWESVPTPGPLTPSSSSSIEATEVDATGLPCPVYQSPGLQLDIQQTEAIIPMLYAEDSDVEERVIAAVARAQARANARGSVRGQRGGFVRTPFPRGRGTGRRTERGIGFLFSPFPREEDMEAGAVRKGELLPSPFPKGSGHGIERGGQEEESVWEGAVQPFPSFPRGTGRGRGRANGRGGQGPA